MKILTAAEFLTKKAKEQLMNNFKELIDIIMMHNEWACSDMFWIDEWDTVLHINIDEKSFNIDGQDLVEWCRTHTSFTNLSDKNITITSLKH